MSESEKTVVVPVKMTESMHNFFKSTLGPNALDEVFEYLAVIGMADTVNEMIAQAVSSKPLTPKMQILQSMCVPLRVYKKLALQGAAEIVTRFVLEQHEGNTRE